MKKITINLTQGDPLIIYAADVDTPKIIDEIEKMSDPEDFIMTSQGWVYKKDLNNYTVEDAI